MIRPVAIFLLFLIATALAARAQEPPPTDILIMPLPERSAETGAVSAFNVTNRAGYDNQPSFTPDGQLLYTSIRDGQADIYRMDLRDGTEMRVTNTPESEYSPSAAPGGGITVVRVEEDGTQRLWRFDENGGNPEVVFESLKPVGYYGWIDARTAAFFVLGDPPTLQIADVGTGRVDTVAAGVGRSLHRIPGRQAVSFVAKAEPWMIREIDLETGVISDVAETLPGREDLVWTPDGRLLMAHGPEIFEHHSNMGWVRLADLSESGIGTITRLAVSADGRLLALVVDRS